jgi:antitoxin PrlF
LFFGIGKQSQSRLLMPTGWLDMVRNIPYHHGADRRNAMPTIHEVATITAKGQITLPKPIRQALGVDYGGKVAFDLRGSQVIVTRADDPGHEDPAIGSFLELLETDVRNGRHLSNLPDDLVQAMLTMLPKSVDITADIEGDVVL